MVVRKDLVENENEEFDANCSYVYVMFGFSEV